MKQTVQVRVAGLIVHHERLLVMVYDYPGGVVHALPGGRLEEGEFAREALEREFREELGIHIEAGDLAFVGEAKASQIVRQTLHMVFHARITYGTPTLNPMETSAKAIEWLPLPSLEGHHLYPDIGAALCRGPQGKPTAHFLGNVMHRQWM